MPLALIPAVVRFASTYGSGTYNAGVYNGSSGSLVYLGPVSLPDTGAGWAVLIGAAALAFAGGWTMWLWQRRRWQQVKER